MGFRRASGSNETIDRFLRLIASRPVTSFWTLAQPGGFPRSRRTKGHQNIAVYDNSMSNKNPCLSHTVIIQMSLLPGSSNVTS